MGEDSGQLLEILEVKRSDFLESESLAPFGLILPEKLPSAPLLLRFPCQALLSPPDYRGLVRRKLG